MVGCESYCAASQEQRHEMNDQQDDKNTTGRMTEPKFTGSDVSKSATRTGSNSSQPTEQIDQKDNTHKIIYIQARIRAFLQRRKYRVRQQTFDSAAKYFKSAENAETIKEGETFALDAPLEIRKYEYSSGAVYYGEWRKNLRQGNGLMKWKDGASYDGQWEFGQACGQGKFIHVGGDEYQGTWYNNKANGKGVYLNKKGARYEGDWKDDQQQGQGVETWAEGARYEGGYLGGMKDGHGHYVWADGSQYTGLWRDNKINGLGTYLWKDGRKYYGTWKDNDMHGYGIYLYNDGVRYDGQYVEDKKQGYGVYYWTDGRKYDGYWYKGKQHGIGIYVDTNKQSVKYGLWENSKRLKWFDQEAIELINAQKFDIAHHFTDTEQSKLGLVEGCKFEKPEKFDENLASIKKALKVALE